MEDELVSKFLATLKKFAETDEQVIEKNARNCLKLAAEPTKMRAYLASWGKCKICASDLLLYNPNVFSHLSDSRLRSLVRYSSDCFVTTETTDIDLLRDSTDTSHDIMQILVNFLNPDKCKQNFAFLFILIF